MSYGTSVTLQVPFDVAMTRVREALAEQGFGVITEIDMKATLAAKIGADIEPYAVLGACNPKLANRALEVDRSIGLLLPCNVVVRAAGPDSTVVEALDPQVMVRLSDESELKPVADEASDRLAAALTAAQGD